MKDETFINDMLQRGSAAKDKVNAAFPRFTSEQLNWKASEKSWSIGQCLEHLMISHSAYFPLLKKINEGTFKMGFWEKHSPFSATFGKILIDRVQEEVKKKMKAPGKIKPSNSTISSDIIERYQKNLDDFLGYMANCKGVDLDKTIITSPVMGMVTYSLRNAFRFLLQHEHRHIKQAIRVKENEGFPER